MQSFGMYSVRVFCHPDVTNMAINLSIKMEAGHSILNGHYCEKFLREGFASIWVVRFQLLNRLNLIKAEIQNFTHDISDCGLGHIKTTWNCRYADSSVKRRVLASTTVVAILAQSS
ncbi:hypothetical protein TNCT_331381 [Trichonephila clavata]|uniref:Uncharacterized protein n=1 Tax=Trichonephila clavata TaxID=2740835 RepID=A0A8X6GY29_TRICU|nr:hypothetical protein TNCT_331381 [Trichonephila clavata]